MLGDTKDWNEVNLGSRHEGAGWWRTEVPLEVGPFLQASTEWTLKEPAPAAALPRTSPDAELRKQDPSST